MVVVLVMFLELRPPMLEEGTGCESGRRLADESTRLLVGLGLRI
jgi:hypothetical protein